MGYINEKYLGNGNDFEKLYNQVCDIKKNHRINDVDDKYYSNNDLNNDKNDFIKNSIGKQIQLELNIFNLLKIIKMKMRQIN
jgi:hypothetical protein